MTKKMTTKQVNVLKVLNEEFNGSAFAEEIVTSPSMDGLTVPSIRATLLSLVPKGVVTKEKGAFDNRSLFKYTVCPGEIEVQLIPRLQEAD